MAPANYLVVLVGCASVTYRSGDSFEAAVGQTGHAILGETPTGGSVILTDAAGEAVSNSDTSDFVGSVANVRRHVAPTKCVAGATCTAGQEVAAGYGVEATGW